MLVYEGKIIGSGIELEVLQNERCIQLMQDFIAANPEMWNEDIGV